MLKRTENRIKELIDEKTEKLEKIDEQLKDLLINNSYSVEDIKDLISFIKEHSIPHVRLKVDNIELEIVGEPPMRNDMEGEERSRNPFGLTDDQIRTAAGRDW
jgi:hypothetical protein